jgi:hypothetical protein
MHRRIALASLVAVSCVEGAKAKPLGFEAGPLPSGDGSDGSDGTIGPTADAAVEGPADSRVGDTISLDGARRDAAAASGTADGAEGRPLDGGRGCRFRFCEDFERVGSGTPPDPKTWSRAGNIVVAPAPAGRPGQAMHVAAGHTPGETYISQTATLPLLGGSFYGRVFLYIASRPADFYHWSFTEVRGADAQGAAVRYGGISEGICQPGMFCRNSFLFQVKPMVYGPDEGATADDDLTPVISEKTWHCVEWFMNTQTSEARLWWNGQERQKVHHLGGPVVFPSFSRLYLGWALYQTGASGVDWDVWLDDVAISDQRIGCDP